MGESKGYNCWTNYETWSIPLFIDNDGGADYWRERTEEIIRDSEPDQVCTRKQRAAITLADALKDEFEENNPLADQCSVYSQLLSGALSEVNWDEIARHYVDDVYGEIEDELGDEDA